MEVITLRGLREDAPRASPRRVGTRTISWGTMMSGLAAMMLADLVTTSTTSISLPTFTLSSSPRHPLHI